MKSNNQREWLGRFKVAYYALRGYPIIYKVKFEEAKIKAFDNFNLKIYSSHNINIDCENKCKPVYHKDGSIELFKEAEDK